MSIMDQVKKNLREWYSLAADRTGEMAKISVRMYDKYGISREIERQLSELGSYVYHGVEQGKTEFADDAEFTAWIERIKELEKDLHEKVAEIDDIRVVRQQKQAQRERDEAAAAAAAAAAAPMDDGAFDDVVVEDVDEDVVIEDVLAEDVPEPDLPEDGPEIAHEFTLEDAPEDAPEELETTEADPAPAPGAAIDESRKPD